jgi:hypothetical protein
MTAHEATVEVLTAEVRVLMVGSRQVTLSVYGQLDKVSPDQIRPFGRVAPRDALPGRIYVIGKKSDGHELVRSCMNWNWPTDDEFQSSTKPEVRDGKETARVLWQDAAIDRWRILPAAWRELRSVALDWSELPLIVLAGLR